MDHITPHMMRQLLSVGFTDPDQEHFLNYGMVYEHQNVCCYIGGRDDADFTPVDRQIAEEGLWLPDAHQLLHWLSRNNFTAEIRMEDGYFHVCATDSLNGHSYRGGGFPLSYALCKVIYKVCKSNCRPSRPEPILRLDIQQEPTDP